MSQPDRQIGPTVSGRHADTIVWPMCSSAVMRHNAFVYDSEATFVTRTVEFLRDGFALGEAAVVANTRDRLALIREGLGDDAARVSFLDVNPIYTRPAWTIAAYYGALSEQLRHAPAVRAVGEMQTGPGADEWQRWLPYEAASNLAYDHLPAWVVCTYDANRVGDRVLEGVWKTHTTVLDDEWQESNHFEDPRALVRRATIAPRALPELRALEPVADLEQLRERLSPELVAAGVPEQRALELLVAATEVGANAITHGHGIRQVRAGRVAGRFVCEITDAGDGFEDPVAGYIVPREGVGTGLWVTRQLVWELEFLHAPEGFTARLWL
jgi:anti-sigma regulatory factor (Ser/Thr protein kinase)